MGMDFTFLTSHFTIDYNLVLSDVQFILQHEKICRLRKIHKADVTGKGGVVELWGHYVGT